MDWRITTFNNEINLVSEWLQANKLSLNISKTHYVLFRRPKAKRLTTKHLKINNVNVHHTTSTRFSGVVIDQNLNFNSHITYIKLKVAKGIAILYKCKRLLSKDTLRTLYYSFIYPYFHYCITVWGNTYKSYIDPLNKLQ